MFRTFCGIIAFLLFVAAAPAQEGRGGVNPYNRQDPADMLDTINRSHGTPRRRSSGRDGMGDANRYSERRYRNDTPGMLDAINRRYGKPTARASRSNSGNRYAGPRYENDAAGMLDAINRDHGVPPARPPVVVDRPWGKETDPYNYRRWKWDSPGMIDAINRDFPPPLPRRR